MCKSWAVLLVAVIAISYSSNMYSVEVARTTSLSTVGRDQGPCVSYPDNQSLGRRSMVRITNFCHEKVFINACLIYRDGSSALYTSGQRIRAGRFMNIFPEVWRRPVAMNVSYGIFEAEVPKPCQAG